MSRGADGRLRVAHLWTPTGWLSPGFLEVNEDGFIAAVAAEQPASWAGTPISSLNGFVVPGMVNLHSHAHQRGLAGHGEGAGGGGSFWGWRTLMYRFVDRLSPEDLQAIAAQAYLEMLESGFTTVGEFHYMHHDRDGQPYANPAETSERILAAAEETGIGLTLLPSLYMQGGIGTPPSSEQRRFVYGRDQFLDLVEHLLAYETAHPWLRVGIAPHSLRAVSAEDLRPVVEVVRQWRPRAPVHIHAAEQAAEVDACLAGLGASPIRWLLDQLPLDDRWTIIHATHSSAGERSEIAHRGAVIGLCPVTEANLGDGLFPLVDYHRGGGRWGIGTDSNIAISVVDELRLLEYGQRLFRQRRDVLVAAGDAMTSQPGRVLYDRAAAWGAQSLAQPVGEIAVGKRADLVELDPDSLAMAGHGTETALDGWLFAGRDDVVRSVFVGGRQVVQHGRHLRRDEVRRRFRMRMAALWAT